jgi:hypothetical protein
MEQVNEALQQVSAADFKVLELYYYFFKLMIFKNGLHYVHLILLMRDCCEGFQLIISGILLNYPYQSILKNGASLTCNNENRYLMGSETVRW